MLGVVARVRGEKGRVGRRRERRERGRGRMVGEMADGGCERVWSGVGIWCARKMPK